MKTLTIITALYTLIGWGWFVIFIIRNLIEEDAIGIIGSWIAKGILIVVWFILLFGWIIAYHVINPY